MVLRGISISWSQGFPCFQDLTISGHKHMENPFSRGLAVLMACEEAKVEVDKRPKGINGSVWAVGAPLSPSHRATQVGAGDSKPASLRNRQMEKS